MKKGQIYSGQVTKVQFPNKGLVELDEGGQAMVKNVIPGQHISCLVTKVRKGRGEGRLVEVLSPSPLELTEPVCAHFGSCGGCTYLSLPIEEQHKLKTWQVRELLEPVCAPYCQFEEIFEGVKASPRQFGYRNKMEFSFGDTVKGGPLALGMHKRGSFHDIVTVEGCRIADEDYSRILAGVLGYFTHQGTPFYHKATHQGYLRHLLVRKGAMTGEILIDLVTTSQEAGQRATGGNEETRKASGGNEEAGLLEGMVNMLLALPLEGRIAGILHTVNDSVADAVINQRTKVLYGQDYFYEELLGLRFKISVFSFFQTNSLGAEVLYETVREYVADAGDGKVVYDLYSGTGTIAQLLAGVAKKVIGVEIVEEAVEAARENGAANGLSNCEFLAGDVLKVLDGIEEKPDFIVLDPPRDGVNPKALKQIIGYGVERMVYVSCKPTSLARDLVVLQEAGYRVERVCCVDMFPASGNVETVVMLSHKKPDSVINVKVEFGEGEGKVPLDNIAKRAAAYKPKERVTYKMIKEYIEAKYGFKVHTAYIAEVKRELGLPMYDAPNAVEELKQPRKHPTAEKVEAIKDALKYFGIIK